MREATEGKSDDMTPQCDGCRRFMRPYDVHTPFGNSEMMEPPDEVWLCRRCSDDWTERLVAEYKDAPRMYLNWRFSDAEVRAVKRCGMVICGEGRAGWACAFKPEAIPEGWHEWDLSERRIEHGFM